MRHRCRISVIPSRALAGAAVALLLVSTAPAALADAGRGEDVFDANCEACHSVLPGKNKVGPSLGGVVGRLAGTAPNYAYSDAMRSCGITWQRDKLEALITKPKAVVPGCKMQFEGLPDAKDRADLIDYLATAGGN